MHVSLEQVDSPWRLGWERGYLSPCETQRDRRDVAGGGQELVLLPALNPHDGTQPLLQRDDVVDADLSFYPTLGLPPRGAPLKPKAPPNAGMARQILGQHQ